MKKVLMWIVLILALLIAGFYALNAYIYHEKQADTASDSTSGVLLMHA